MKRRSFYTVIAVFFIVGLLGTLVAPAVTLAVLLITIPVMVIAAIISTVYLGRVYLWQPVPRSRFFGMLVESFYALIAIGLWLGYVSLARITERAREAGTIGWVLPAPSPAHAAPISALVVVVVFAAPVRFALEVWRQRRRSPPPATAGSSKELDRQPSPEEQ